MATGLVWHELFAWHDTGAFAGVLPPGGFVQPGRHLENAESKRRLKNLIDVSGLGEKLRPIAPRPAEDGELLRFHTRDYLRRLKEMSETSGGDAGLRTPFGRGGFEIAALSAGGVIEAMEAVVHGRVSNVYALVRPPGHHALSDLGMGFCMLGNIAVAVHHALAAHKMERVAVVDWDVHHGNGTEAAFWKDPRVLTISIHQDRMFPLDTGSIADIGEEAGEGYNINIPLPPGSGTGAYDAAFDQVVVPALRRFAPDMIFVASGFDASAHDPLGRMMLHSEAYRRYTTLIMEVAADCCGGRIVMAHEGGYSEHLVPFLGLAVIEQLSGERTAVEDPSFPVIAKIGGQELFPHQEAIVRAAGALIGRIAQG